MKYSYSHNGEEFEDMCDSIKHAISEASTSHLDYEARMRATAEYRLAMQKIDRKIRELQKQQGDYHD